MCDSLAEYSEVNDIDLQMRIGLNSGPVVAGVIGKRRFLYDLWGDSVNTASRMESHGIPGEIQVTEATRDLLEVGSRFTFVDRGVIDIKGKGPMQTYLLKRNGHAYKGRLYLQWVSPNLRAAMPSSGASRVALFAAEAARRPNKARRLQIAARGWAARRGPVAPSTHSPC